MLSRHRHRPGDRHRQGTAGTDRRVEQRINPPQIGATKRWQAVQNSSSSDSTSSTRQVSTVRRWASSLPDGAAVSDDILARIAGVVIGAHYRQKPRRWNAKALLVCRRWKPNGQPVAKLGKQPQPCKRPLGLCCCSAASAALFAIQRLLEFIKSVLGPPQIDGVRRCCRKNHRVEQRLQHLGRIGQLAQLVGQSLQQALKRKTDRRLVQPHTAALHFVEQPPNFAKIGTCGAKLSQNCRLKRLFRRRLQRRWQRRAGPSKAQRAARGVIDFPQLVVDFRPRIAQQLVENSPLIVAKELAAANKSPAQNSDRSFAAPVGKSARSKGSTRVLRSSPRKSSPRVSTTPPTRL